jgi:hypothetical protein
MVEWDTQGIASDGSTQQEEDSRLEFGSGHRDPETLLGLYRGYDAARVALARLAGQMGRHPACDDTTLDAVVGLSGGGVASPSAERVRQGVQQGAQAAAFAAFSLVCEQAEALRRSLVARWPELREDLGGPLPVRANDPPANPENCVVCEIFSGTDPQGSVTNRSSTNRVPLAAD